MCHLCGNLGEMTFEHYPPKAAYNDRPVLVGHVKDWERGYGREYQTRGRGGHVLCGRCNNFTGGSYGPAFVEWSKNGFDRLYQTSGRSSLNYHGEIYPLRVLK